MEPYSRPLSVRPSPANGGQPFGGQEKVSSNPWLSFVRGRILLKETFFFGFSWVIPVEFLCPEPYFSQEIVFLLFSLRGL